MWPARLRSLLFFVAVCCLVTSCANTPPVGMPTEQNVPGTCKTLSTAEEMVTSSDVSPAVPCTSEHVYETYAVTSVPESIAGLPERPGPELLQAQTRNVCPYKPIRPYLGATELDAQWGISIWPKFPTRKEWARDVRVVTCSLVVNSSHPDQVPVNTLPLRDVMRYDDSAQVRQCRIGPTRDNVTCDEPHAGERMGTIAVDPALGGDAARVAALDACTERILEYTGQATVAGYVADYTATGGGGVECWLTSINGEVTGTQRGGLVPR